MIKFQCQKVMASDWGLNSMWRNSNVILIMFSINPSTEVIFSLNHNDKKCQ